MVRIKSTSVFLLAAASLFAASALFSAADFKAMERKSKCKTQCRAKFLRCKESAKKKPEKEQNKYQGICSSLYIDCVKRCDR